MKTTAYWIEGPWRGRLAIVARPRGGDWLEDEVRAWRAAGIDVVVSLLGSDEAAELDIVEEATLCKANEIEFVTLPILDRGLPSSTRTFAQLVLGLEQKLARGKKVAVHCRQGIGRSAMLAASLLIGAGVDASTAWDRISAARGRAVPDTAEQRDWVDRFACDLLIVSAKEQ